MTSSVVIFHLSSPSAGQSLGVLCILLYTSCNKDIREMKLWVLVQITLRKLHILVPRERSLGGAIFTTLCMKLKYCFSNETCIIVLVGPIKQYVAQFIFSYNLNCVLLSTQSLGIYIANKRSALCVMKLVTVKHAACIFMLRNTITYESAQSSLQRKLHCSSHSHKTSVSMLSSTATFFQQYALQSQSTSRLNFYCNDHCVTTNETAQHFL